MVKRIDNVHFWYLLVQSSLVSMHFTNGQHIKGQVGLMKPLMASLCTGSLSTAFYQSVGSFQLCTNLSQFCGNKHKERQMVNLWKSAICIRHFVITDAPRYLSIHSSALGFKLVRFCHDYGWKNSDIVYLDDYAIHKC